jgi:hypothetical protein
MAKRKVRAIDRLRTVTVYRDGKIGYYSRDRLEGGISPTYATDAQLATARVTRAGSDGTRGKWPEGV